MTAVTRPRVVGGVTYSIEKEWDENECVHEARNGRTYTRPMGLRWVVLVDGQPDSDHDLRREAIARIDVLSGAVCEHGYTTGTCRACDPDGRG